MTVLSGIYQVTTAGIEVQNSAENWLYLIVGLLYIGLGLFAVVAVFKRRASGVRWLGVVYKAGLAVFVVYDIIFVVNTCIMASNDEVDSSMVYATIPVLAMHVVYYVCTYYMLGTVKSLANVLAAGGTGAERKNAGSFAISS
ncbi:MAG: uncharacterized protein KVP18_001814 [Porospora cf. gigantea A]|uniref:uncharacterized protein n=1 Tax=Porospora cf. gigantea A TaxID=2853593 RepID=UPI0035593762|nr:MAG: hypothetical protein KVP18_001814 [Porospora cf. gigantea A]